MANKQLLVSFYLEINKFLKATKSELANKKYRKVDDGAADLISQTPYELKNS